MNSGYLAGIFSFGFWGLIALYWKELSAFDSYELLGHRIFWGVLTFLVYILFKKPWGNLKACIDTKKKRQSLYLTTGLIFSNWFVFVWAVGSGHVLEASIGYFINPLINVALGVFILKETLRPRQRVAVVLAFLGLVILLSSGVGRIDISLFLACTFGTYGLLRKRMNIPSMEGLFFEMLLSLTPILIYFFYKEFSGAGLSFFKVSSREQFLAALAGIVTLIPLVTFNYAVKKIPLISVGLLQYIAPTLQFILAVFVYGELFTKSHAYAFSLIWGALIIYTFDLVTSTRTQRVASA
ncbi:EamA family transporter RarD [Halobacteriovorax sp. JY17]|uniref:EamA family transporter RarD n=1 Tax=Halobacteriovorax sp. JY17 TaxID=2014617 RepID=UPI000C4D8EE7|nr:EamA family transporter RarD [Halobacteriovorax sp. JY17]PIK16217.1 MAG: protein RarD [Halobacteriovorax sp. JY17]